MKVEPRTIVTEADVYKYFTNVAKLAEEKGQTVVFKYNQLKCLIIDFDTEPQIEMSEDEKFKFVTSRILCECFNAFKELLR